MPPEILENTEKNPQVYWKKRSHFSFKNYIYSIPELLQFLNLSYFTRVNNWLLLPSVCPTLAQSPPFGMSIATCSCSGHLQGWPWLLACHLWVYQASVSLVFHEVIFLVDLDIVLSSSLTGYCCRQGGHTIWGMLHTSSQW